VIGDYTGFGDGGSFIWDGGTFTKFDVPGSVYGFNDSGQVTGYYRIGERFHGFIASIAPPVPEPEEWALMLVGLGRVGFQVKRKEANRLAF
jgi:hypothetical protein